MSFLGAWDTQEKHGPELSKYIYEKGYKYILRTVVVIFSAQVNPAGATGQGSLKES